MKKIIFTIFCFVFLFSANLEAKIPTDFQETYNEILNDKELANLGNPKGKFVIIEFFDYRCTYSRITHKLLADLIHSKKAPNVRWISIETPVFGLKNNEFSDIIVAAKGQKKYQKLYELSIKRNYGGISDLLNTAAINGMNPKKLMQDSSSPIVQQHYAKNLKRHSLLKHKGVYPQAVPTLIINDFVVFGSLNKEGVEYIIKESNK